MHWQIFMQLMFTQKQAYVSVPRQEMHQVWKLQHINGFGDLNWKQEKIIAYRPIFKYWKYWIYLIQFISFKVLFLNMS